MVEEKKRIDSVDFIKGICIFLVVWAHTIQNTGAGNTFWDNPVFIFICSFHMPIFMLISGFFFSNVIQKKVKDVVQKKVIQLLIPCFGWSLVLVLIQSILLAYNGYQLSFFEQIKQLFYETGTRFWFLRSVFICYLLALLSMKIFKKDYVACVVSVIFCLLLPDSFRLALDKFMYPFFWIGYFMHKHLNLVNKYKKTIAVTTLAIFVFLLFFWRKEFYIYITGMSFYEIKNDGIIFFPFWERFNIVTFRYMIGSVGSVFFFIVLQQIFQPKSGICTIIRNVGKYTLGIYPIHILVEGLLLSNFDFSHVGFILFNFVVTPSISIALIAICIVIIKVLQRNKYTNLLFLGTK